jgi:SAM-dependent methyltransferase
MSLIRLLYIRFKTGIFNTIEWSKVIWRYYRKNFAFAQLDLALWAVYASRSPYKISREFLKQQKSTSLYEYGETPLTTLEHIAKECGIRSQDTVAELGSGTGRSCFWLATFVQCHVIGIEYIPEFIANAKALQEGYHIANVQFLHADMSCVILYNPTYIYLYGTIMEDAEIRSLAAVLAKEPKGTKLITVSWALEEFAPEAGYSIVKRFQASFPWGTGDVFLQQKQ